ncbi:MAG: carbohydrate ABC transporter permease [Propioniciclava sp.]
MSTVTPTPRSRAGGSAVTRQGSRQTQGFELTMMAPALILLALLSIVPFITLIVMSFSEVKTLGGVRLEFAGLANWIDVLSDTTVWAAWGRSLIYFTSIVAVEFILGFIIALVLHAVTRGRSVVLAVVIMPMFFAPVIVGLMGRFLMDSTIGLYAQILETLGMGGDVFANPATAFPTLILMDAWEWTPLIALIMLAGLTSVPESTLEAAAVDGAGFFRRLVSIIIPQMKSIILVALLIRSMDAIRYYDIVTATTNGGPADSTKIVPLKLYEFAFRFDGQMGNAAVLGLTMLAFSILLANLFVRVFADREQSGTGPEEQS